MTKKMTMMVTIRATMTRARTAMKHRWEILKEMKERTRKTRRRTPRKERRTRRKTRAPKATRSTRTMTRRRDPKRGETESTAKNKRRGWEMTRIGRKKEYDVYFSHLALSLYIST